MALLAAALLLGQFLDRRKISWFGDAAAALGLGVLIGLVAKVAGSDAQMRDVLAFKVLQRAGYLMRHAFHAAAQREGCQEGSARQLLRLYLHVFGGVWSCEPATSSDARLAFATPGGQRGFWEGVQGRGGGGRAGLCAHL